MEFKRVYVPTLTPVESSNIKAVGYEDGDLYIEYKSSSVYMYKNVPRNLYEDLLKSDSKGRFMNANIKSKFDYDYLR